VGALNKAQEISLNDLGKDEGWDASQSIWSWGYFQDHGKLMDELSLMAAALSSNNVDLIPFEKMPGSRGRQLVLHLVPGVAAAAVGPDLYRKMAKLGVNVVQEDGRLLRADGTDKVPVTVVVHRSIEHEKLLTLQSDLSGTTVRDSQDRFWIDFPCFVTGSASWLEAVSCGAISLHDGVDCSPGRKGSIVQSTIVRMLALRYAKLGVKRTFGEIEAVARYLVGDFMMGGANGNYHIGRYKNFEDWTLDAREYSDAMYLFNMIDDICAQIVRIDQEKKAAAGPASTKLNDEAGSAETMGEAA